jgi:AraC-like DNA-binding protein
MHLFQTNEIFIIGADQPHVFKNTSSYFATPKSKAILSLDIFFDPTIISNSLLNIPELKNLRAFIQKAQYGFKVPEHTVKKVSAKMTLIKHLDNGLERTLQFIELLNLLASIPAMESLSDSISSVYNNENESIRISQIYNYILHNYEKNLTLENIAQQAYMTPQAFCRYFKKHTRQTFVSFLNEVRINEARKIFAQGNFESISSVAYNCGFNSITNFNRVFKTITLQAPSHYIESLNKNILENAV